MSRIHEALKKAESERAAVQTSDVKMPGHGANREQTEHPASGNNGSAVGVLTEAPPSASVPAVAHAAEMDQVLAHCAQRDWSPNPQASVFSDAMKNPNSAEQFRTLRSRLYQLRGNQALRVLLVTSPVPSEGKTFVTSNLAQAFVRQTDRRVLVIDADLRRSTLHTALGAQNGPGLSDLLRGNADESAVIQRGRPEGLFLIPSGAAVSNPSELLSNGRLKTVLDRLSPAFDWVLIDSPPCLPVADASMIADFCDGVLLVVRAGSTPSAVVQKAGQELRGRKVVGVVLNQVEQEGIGYASYYGTSQYGLELAKK